jgi:SAM-dependent methyltransferase
MNVVESWARQNFQVFEVDSAARVYSGMGPISWQRPQPELERELDINRPGDWWRMACLMDLSSCLTSDMRILDVGCGPGWPSIPFSTYVKEIVAVDSSELAISLARLNIQRRGVLNIRLGYGHAANLPFDDMSFDGVIASDLMDVVPDPVEVASEMFRVLKPGGVLVSWVQNFRFITRDKQWVRSAPLDGDALVYICHCATLDPPSTAEMRFSGKALHPMVREMNLPTKPEPIATDSILTELRKLYLILDKRMELYRTVGFTPETAIDPFKEAGFTDLEVMPLNPEMCVAFARKLAEKGMLPDSMEGFQALASALLDAMQYADFSSSSEISVKGRR